jgi:hypothetical protein
MSNIISGYTSYIMRLCIAMMVLSTGIVSMFWMLRRKTNRIGAGVGVAIRSSKAEKVDVVSHCRYATSDQWWRIGHTRTGES